MNDQLMLRPISRRFEENSIQDVVAATREAFSAADPQIGEGASIAITAGSRGIADIPRVIRTVAEWLVERGARPFVIPAMGSHGGATAAGQEELLRGYGITEETVGVPIRATMETVRIEDPDGRVGNRVFMDRYAWESDGVVLINRIKAHTDFRGSIESGLMKMCVIGLGKHDQALEIHSFGVKGLRDHIPATARHLFRTGKIAMGVGLVENAYDRLMAIDAFRPDDIEAGEKRLLEVSKAHMPGLPVEEIDVLIIDRMGKDFSGCGVDPNIIGRMYIQGEPEFDSPRVDKIIIADLSDASHGNAIGLGLADFVTRRLFDKIDFGATYENVLTSTFLERGKIPLIAADDLEAFRFARKVCRGKDDLRVVRIPNTLELTRAWVSENVWQEISSRPEIESAGDPEPAFESDGTLRSFQW